MNWNIIELDSCDSTFSISRKHPAWTIVTTRHQTNGRGRFNRTWFGEPGGLWASFNVALDLHSNREWGLMPLVAGLAIIRYINSLGVPAARLRWPNDILVGKKKLAGILVERPARDMATIGLGLNIFNDIQSLEGKTQDEVARLADLLSDCPSVEAVRDGLAHEIEQAMAEYIQRGEQALTELLEPCWGTPRKVCAQTDAGDICGIFLGIETDGSPRLQQEDRSIRIVSALEVNRLVELE